MAKEKGKASFILYFEYKDYFEQLSVEERGELITAIFDYVVTGETKKLKGASEMAFAFIRAQIQRDLDKYEERCRVNKENGALSHKGKKESLSKPSKKDQTVANGTLNDNVPVPKAESVPETVPETESVPESVSESVAVAETESAHPNVGEDLRQNSTIRQEQQKATENHIYLSKDGFLLRMPEKWMTERQNSKRSAVSRNPLRNQGVPFDVFIFSTEIVISGLPVPLFCYIIAGTTSAA